MFNISPGGPAPHDFDFPAQQSCKTPRFLTTHGKVKITPEFPGSCADREFPTSPRRAEAPRVGTGRVVSPPSSLMLVSAPQKETQHRHWLWAGKRNRADTRDAAQGEGRRLPLSQERLGLCPAEGWNHSPLSDPILTQPSSWPSLHGVGPHSHERVKGIKDVHGDGDGDPSWCCHNSWSRLPSGPGFGVQLSSFPSWGSVDAV